MICNGMTYSFLLIVDNIRIIVHSLIRFTNSFMLIFYINVNVLFLQLQNIFSLLKPVTFSYNVNGRDMTKHNI
jgi:hypothetical protein